MYHFGTTNNDIYEQGVDEGRRQILADLAKIYKDANKDYPDDALDDFASYLEQEDYL